MGLNILVQDVRGNDHPHWDCIRQGDDVRFSMLIEPEDQIFTPLDPNHDRFQLRDIEEIWGRVDAADWTEESKERYYRLLDIMYGNGWYLNFSV